MMRRRATAGPLRIESLAGWVFADLLLVLFIVGLGAQVTQVPVSSPEPKPTPKPAIVVGMREDPVTIKLSADVDALLSGSSHDRAAAKRALRRQIQRRTSQLGGERAAMTLIWGCGPSADVGQPLARAAGRQLERARPKVFKRAAEKPLWDGWSDGSCRKGGIELEIYLYTSKPAAN